MSKVKIEMLVASAGTDEGKECRTYLDGQVYEVGEKLAEVFISQKLAFDVNDRDKVLRERKAILKAEKRERVLAMEKKAMLRAPENKANKKVAKKSPVKRKKAK
jgi:hypothetical protein